MVYMYVCKRRGRADLMYLPQEPGTDLEVDHDDGDLRAGGHEDEEDAHQEALLVG